jgi:hypothetical protein
VFVVERKEKNQKVCKIKKHKNTKKKGNLVKISEERDSLHCAFQQESLRGLRVDNDLGLLEKYCKPIVEFLAFF